MNMEARQQQQQPVKGSQEERYIKIRKQIEYYFGDINLFKDRFLKTYHQRSDGWLIDCYVYIPGVPIDILMAFKHLQEITTSKNEVIIAIKYRSDLVEVSEDDENVRRRRTKPEGEHQLVLQDYKSRSVFIGNLPLSATFDEIKNEYLGLFDGISSFVMRRDCETQRFRGSIFATFETEELARAFLANPTAKLFRSRFLTRQMQLDYEKKHPPHPLPRQLLEAIHRAQIR